MRNSDRFQNLSMQWDELVTRIQEQRGFDTFLRPTPFSSLVRAAIEGPVILVNISEIRSDAILLLPSPRVAGSLICTSIRLPEATPETVCALSMGPSDGFVNAKSHEMVDVLRDLWRIIVQPVMHELEKLGVARQSRIWWCPTGETWSLPLHAAGPYRKGQRNLPDLFVSSYTPTLMALIRAREKTGRVASVSSPKILIVGQPDALPQAPLASVPEEIGIVRQLMPRALLLEGERGTCEAVLTAMADHPWVHLACHGIQDHLQPFESRFLLHDRPLHLLDIVKNQLPSAELAFLSACHSAAGDKRTPDESIHLAAAMMFTGYRSVVGTMWEMEDEDGPTVVREFYTYMTRKPSPDCTDAAEALAEAVKVLRKRKVPLQRWINFVHYGA